MIVVRTSFNGGPGLARKLGVEQSAGHAIAFLDSDDVYEGGWIDEGLDQLLKHHSEEGGVFLAGGVRRGSIAISATYWLLTGLPPSWRRVASRLAVVMFNPFYTPSLMLSRDLCQFSNSLRHCEDYYTNAMALFKARTVILSRSYACSLSRRPGSLRGESGNTREMLRGELSTRWAILVSGSIPVIYRLLVPLGVAYQFTRASAQWILGMCGFGRRTSLSDARV